MLVTEYYNRLEDNKNKLLKAILYTSNLHNTDDIILETDYSMSGNLIYIVTLPPTVKFKVVLNHLLFINYTQLNEYSFKFSIKDNDINKFYLNAINYI